MAKIDPRIDAYIAAAPPFAQPILELIREVVHDACPEAEETIKWGRPTFMHHGLLCAMVVFKEYAGLGFWKGTLVLGGKTEKFDESSGQFGQLRSVKDLPSRRVLTGYVKEAARLNVAGVSVPKPKRAPKPPVVTPPELVAALRKNKKAAATWDGFAPSMRREYVEWIDEAKTAPTRERRVAQTVEWLAEGKQRNWKYQK